MVAVQSIRRTLLVLAVREARQYGATAREVLASFALGDVRPELKADLDTQLAALGIPPEDAIAQAEQVFRTDEVGIEDLLLLVQGYAGQTPKYAQAREIYEVSARLMKMARRHEKRIGQAQIIADAIIEQENAANPPPVQPPRTFHRTAARTVTMPGRGIGR